MSSKIDGLIAEWAEDVIKNCDKSGFSGINVIEKILRDPGISTGGGKHKVLWWPRNRRIAMMSRAMHQIDAISQICLIVKYGSLLKEDGNRFTRSDLAKNSSLGLRKINTLVKKARNKLSSITKA